MRNFYRYPYYRGTVPPSRKPPREHICTPPLHPPPIPKPPLLKPCPPPKKPKKDKFDFECLKKDTCKSLNEVEHFLCNFNDFVKYVKLINLLKK